MIPLPGSIYFDPQFEFIDGKLGPKLFVVLCDSPREESAVIVARTTSQAKTDIVRACFSNMHPPNFCFPMQSNWFDEHTWILFDYIVSYESGILERWQEKS